MVLADYLRIKLVVPLQEKLRNEGRSAERLGMAHLEPPASGSRSARRTL